MYSQAHSFLLQSVNLASLPSGQTVVSSFAFSGIVLNSANPTGSYTYECARLPVPYPPAEATMLSTCSPLL